MTSTEDLSAVAVLADARRRRAEAAALEVGVLLDAVEWCHLHPAATEDDAASWHEGGVGIAGEGAPLVAEFAVAEFGAALGLSTDSARHYLGEALELAHRLPRLFARVVEGKIPVWRARRIAERTIALSVEAAAHVDQTLAPFAHKTGVAATDRAVDEAVLRFMPGVAAELAKRAAEHRHVTIAHDTIAGSGTSSLYGVLDTADACDLDNALVEAAAALRAAGSEEPLDVRRAIALGDLARGQAPLDYALDGEPAGAPAPGAAPTRPRDLTLYLHLNADDPSVIGVENAGGQLITPETLTRWFDTGRAQVTVKPVIDLSKPLSTSAYEIPDKIREHVTIRNKTCIFPNCTRSSRHCDLDHIEPYDPDGPPDQTCTGNLAPLCRRHHRLKTFGRWSYTMLEPGTYLWRSPHGYTYLVDQAGTTDLTPQPLEPPGG